MAVQLPANPASNKTREQHMADITQMTDQELRVKLVSFGENVCPIGPSVRPLYEKKLLRYLTGELAEKKPEETTTVVVSEMPTPVDPSKLDPNSEEKISFFSIAVPAKSECSFSAEGRIYAKKEDALKVAKKIFGARFKVFSSYPEALEYAQQPADVIIVPKEVPKDKKEPAGESTTFRGPKIQELVKLRRGIELGNTDDVRNLIWENPRFLISSGDTPVILQEGFRYNALHVACWKNRPACCRLLLETLEDEAFMAKLYPQDSEAVRQERIKHICDLYLNMPDKGNMETPLHFACKYGYMDLVQVLTMHPECNRQRKNKYGETPEQMICCRIKNPPASTVDSIKEMLSAEYYVPLLRAVDNSSPAIIGTAYSPEASKAIPSKLGVVQNSPKEAPLAVRAFAGPMSPSQAHVFRHQWLTPPSPSRREYHSIRRGDCEKGLERIGRQVAHELGIPWSEYWDFLGSFIDLQSANGLSKLEDYLAAKYEALRSERDLDADIQKLEEKLMDFHVTSPPRNADGEIIELPNTREFDWKGSADDSISEWLNSSVGELSVSNGPNSDKKESEILRKPVLWTDIGEISSAKHEDDNKPNIYVPDPLAKHFSNSFRPRHGSGNSPSGDSGETNGHTGFNRVRTLSRGDDCDGASDVDSEVMSYYTAMESLEHGSLPGDLEQEDLDSPPPEANVYLDGCEPSKLDLDVLRALNPKTISPQIHPNITRWQQGVLSFSEQDRNSWKSPMGKRKRPADDDDDDISPPGTPVRPYTAEDVVSPEGPFENAQKNLMSSFLSL